MDMSAFKFGVLDILKMPVGFVLYFIRMNKMESKKSFTEEWWNGVENALAFLPKPARRVIIQGVVLMGLTM